MWHYIYHPATNNYLTFNFIDFHLQALHLSLHYSSLSNYCYGSATSLLRLYNIAAEFMQQA